MTVVLVKLLHRPDFTTCQHAANKTIWQLKKDSSGQGMVALKISIPLGDLNGNLLNGDEAIVESS